MNIGALTTTFIPGPGCNDTIYGLIHSEGTIRDKFHSLGQTDTQLCYPSAFSVPSAYYSPGICPSAWSSACGNVESIGTMTETRVTCCPVGYICATTQDKPWYTYSCSRYYTDPPMIKVPQMSGDKTIYMETTLAGGMVAYANQIEVRYQKKDFEPAATSTEPASQTTLSPSRPTAKGASATTTAGENIGSDTELSRGAYAGIGVGVAAVLIALLVALLFCLRRRKGKKADVRQAELADEGWTPVGAVHEMAPSEPVGEMGSTEPRIIEVKGDEVMPRELDPGPRIHELR